MELDNKSLGLLATGAVGGAAITFVVLIVILRLIWREASSSRCDCLKSYFVDGYWYRNRPHPSEDPEIINSWSLGRAATTNFPREMWSDKNCERAWKQRRGQICSHS